jgi:hypothetical protein
VSRRSKYYDPIEWAIQRRVDRVAPHKSLRWAAFAALLLAYGAWVWFRPGWYLVTYGLAVHLVGLAVRLITPVEDDEGRPLLPTTTEVSHLHVTNCLARDDWCAGRRGQADANETPRA